MNIAIYNAKGGVGKSSIALALSQVLDLPIVTNDVNHPYNLALNPKQYYLIPKGKAIPRFNDGVINDFGGFGDGRMLDFFTTEKKLVLLIPFTADVASFQVALRVWNEVKGHTQNVIFVLNRAKKGDYDVFQEQMKRLGIERPLVELVESRLFQNLFNNGTKIEDVKGSKLFSYTYRNALSSLEQLVKEIEQ